MATSQTQVRQQPGQEVFFINEQPDFGDYALDDTGKTAVFLGTAPATSHCKKLALLVVLVLLVALLSTAPWAGTQLIELPAFVPAYDAAIGILDLVTALLLYAQYRQTRERSFLSLTCGYVFTPILILGHALSFPDAFIKGSLIGDSQTTAWLWMGWHAIFPLFIAGYSVFRNREGAGRVKSDDSLQAIPALASTVMLAIVVVLLCSVADQFLPRIMAGSRYSSNATRIILSIGWLTHLLALVLLWRHTRFSRVIDVWLGVSLTSMMIDLALSALLVDGRYQLGFYAGRVYGLFAAAVFVLAVLIRETILLYGNIVNAATTLKESEEKLKNFNAILSREVEKRTLALEQGKALLQATMDSNPGMIQVFEAVRNEAGEIVDFSWVLNNHTSESIYGNVIGESLLRHNPGVVAEGIFDTFKQVVSTGTPDTSERHYTHEQFNGWFLQTTVKLNDGVATNTIDITEQKEKERELIKQKDLLRAAERIAHVGSWERNLRTNELMWSDELYRIYGLSPAEVMPSTEVFIDQIVHPDDKIRVKEHVQRIYAGDVQSMQYRVIGPEGEVRVVYAEPEIIFDKDNKPEVLRGITVDITERKKAEEEVIDALAELAMQNQVYGFGEQIVSVGTWTWNPLTNKARYSDNMFRLLGLVPQSVVPSFDTIPQYIHPDDRPAMLEKAAAMKDTLQDGKGTEFRIIRADGVIRYCRNRTKVLHVGTEPLYIGTMEDITDEVALRQELADRTRFAESLSDASVDRILVLDKELRFVEWNKRCEVDYGKKKEEVIGKSAVEVFPRISENLDLMNAIDQAFSGSFAYFTDKQGDYASGYYESFLIPLKDANGLVDKVLNVIHDTTDRKRAEEALQRKNEELMAVNKELSSLAAVTGYNLKEPLRRVYSFIEMAFTNRDSSFSADTRMYLRRAQASIQRMNLLTDDLIAFTQVSDEERMLTEVDLNHAVKYVLHQHKKAIEETGACIKVDSLPTVKGYHTLISKMLNNLLDNALKFRKEDASPVIKITATEKQGIHIEHPSAHPSHSYTCLRISDNGIGFEQRHEHVIFQMFQRLVRKNEYGGGNGVGLAICKRIAEMHGGFIAVKSSPGDGTTFEVYLDQAC